MTSGAAMMVWPRPPMRSRASSTMHGEAGVFQRMRRAEAGGAGADDGDIDCGGEGDMLVL